MNCLNKVMDALIVLWVTIKINLLLRTNANCKIVIPGRNPSSMLCIPQMTALHASHLPTLWVVQCFNAHLQTAKKEINLLSKGLNTLLKTALLAKSGNGLLEVIFRAKIPNAP